MDFTPTEEQAEAQGLAARIFGDLSTPERLAASGTGTDAELWKALCAAGLPAAVEDIGLLGLVLLLEEQGRTTAQVPFAVTCVYGLLAVAEHGTAEQRERLLPALRDGTAVATGAFPARSGVRSAAVSAGAGGGAGAVGAGSAGAGGADAELSGVVPYVPWLRDATHVLVADADQVLWIVRTGEPGATVLPVETTAPWSAARLVLDGARGERLGEAGAGGSSAVGGSSGAGERTERARSGAYASVLAAARTAFAGLQAGVCAGSLARAVEHTATREQFGRPLSTNQGVLLRAADAHMDVEAIRVTAYEAAWRRDQRLPCLTQALTAAWWAAEAGRRVVHAGQHLHGGTGADLDHPVHRHFLWGRQLDAYLGGGGEVLQELGESLADEEREAS
ncbi:acyl-CoA/acyl-ACP dehydrogenase [Streptomyces sp. NBC_00654]|uniref:acyl-CoA dehydrogenase family protein n=1 Tax=Streptomyces sp. NBC_00654 TaxID=2975799 RepID=UPI002251FEA5|nr:acyl-CoA dehydrogenase family protein [Streptomyces sp. NBC_00654]MCX4963287.1 acyl-CoA/acyl-ACP dehydrogenase [Streptomyces sp. NBC_00654]